MEPTISPSEMHSHALGWTFLLHSASSCWASLQVFHLKGHSGAGGQTGPRERWADWRGENSQAGLCDRVAAGSGWALGTLSLSSISPRARQRGRSRVSSVRVCCLLGQLGLPWAQRPPWLPAVLSVGVQAGRGTSADPGCPPLQHLCPCDHQQPPAGSSQFLCLPRTIFPTLHKHYFISCGGFSHLRPAPLPPPAPTLQACWHSLISHSWYFSPARDNSGGSNFTVL